MALLIFGVFASLSLHVLWCDDLRCVVSVSSVLCVLRLSVQCV